MNPSDLIGTWHFDRAIHDRSDAANYRATGETTFTPVADGRIRWSERGVLSWDGGSAPVERTLFLCPADAHGHPSPDANRRWVVTFEDGREFHDWAVGDVAHWCAPDSYRGTLATGGDPADAWSITWTVTGPHKDYTMTTTYRRDHAAQSSSAAGPSDTSTANCAASRIGMPSSSAFASFEPAPGPAAT